MFFKITGDRRQQIDSLFRQLICPLTPYYLGMSGFSADRVHLSFQVGHLGGRDLSRQFVGNTNQVEAPNLQIFEQGHQHVGFINDEVSSAILMKDAAT
ncbi:hypothetical protein D3C81_799220 [compost metagenome]